MDVLSDILDTIALKAAIYFRTDFYPAFSIAVPAYGRAARFHLVVQGHCYVKTEVGKYIKLRVGDLALIPNGAAHLLSSHNQPDGAPLADVMNEAGFAGAGAFVVGTGAPGESCQMVCGHYSFAEGADHPLLRAIPDLLHITAAERAARPIFDDVMRLVVRRMFEGDPGAEATVARLSEIVFMEAMRTGMNQVPEIERLMSAFNHPQIGKSLAYIHEDVAAAWTVENLAAAVGMSRTRFAERFRALVGCGPIKYLADWRLQCALRLLREDKLPIKKVAARVGYQSAAGFTRAFSSHFGYPPKYRRVEGAE